MDAGLTLKLKSCVFLTDVINYVGVVIWPGCLEDAKHTTDVIQKLETPATITELRSFIGHCSLFLPFRTDSCANCVTAY